MFEKRAEKGMSLSEREVLQILTKKRALSQIHARGYEWFRSCYLPVLDSRSAIYPELESKGLLALGHYCAGEVHDLNSAPRAALREYHKSVALCDTFGAAWCEAGCIYRELGQYSKATYCLRRAVSVDPRDDRSRQELGFVENSNLRLPPLYRKGDIQIATNELLARGRPKSVLRKLKSVRSVIARQQCARAYGALQDQDGVVREWERISRYKGTIVMDYADWFYFGKLAWDNKKFWMLMHKCVERFCHNVGHTSTFGIWPYPKELVRMRMTKRDDQEKQIRSWKFFNECRLELLIVLNLTRVSGCQEWLRNFLKQHPDLEMAGVDIRVCGCDREMPMVRD